MLAAPNALMMTGGATTVIDALVVLPGPPSREVTWVVLFFTPAVVPCTFTERTQKEFDASVAPDRLTEPDPATAVAVPPQELLNAFGVATTSPDGRVSVNATPVKLGPLFGLVTMNVSEVVPPSGMLDVPNDLLIVGGPATTNWATAALPVPPLVDVTLLVTLGRLPACVAVTLTVTVQVLPRATVPPVKLAFPDPAVAVTLPPQVLIKPFGVDTTIPGGIESMNATPVSASPGLGLVIVIVSAEVPFNEMDDGLNALAMDGGERTVTFADAVPPVPPSVDVTLPVVLFFAPAVEPKIPTEKLHDEFCASVAPLRLIDPLAATAVMVPPPQLPTRLFGLFTTRPAGRLSVNPTPVRLLAALLF